MQFYNSQKEYCSSVQIHHNCYRYVAQKVKKKIIFIFTKFQKVAFINEVNERETNPFIILAVLRRSV